MANPLNERTIKGERYKKYQYQIYSMKRFLEYDYFLIPGKQAVNLSPHFTGQCSSVFTR
jgi:hypothetical protein